MKHVEFKSREQFEAVFSCRASKQGPCESCLLGVTKEACEEGYFFGLEGRPATDVVITVGANTYRTTLGENGRPCVERVVRYSK